MSFPQGKPAFHFTGRNKDDEADENSKAIGILALRFPGRLMRSLGYSQSLASVRSAWVCPGTAFALAWSQVMNLKWKSSQVIAQGSSLTLMPFIDPRTRATGTNVASQLDYSLFLPHDKH